MTKAWANLVTAVGQQDKEGLSSTAPCEILEKFQTGIIAPMHIFNDQQQGLLCRLAQEEMRQGGEEAAFLLFGVERERRRQSCHLREELCDLWEQGRQFAGKRCHETSELSGIGVEEDRVQHVEQWRVGTGMIGREAITLQGLEALSQNLCF